MRAEYLQRSIRVQIRQFVRFGLAGPDRISERQGLQEFLQDVVGLLVMALAAIFRFEVFADQLRALALDRFGQFLRLGRLWCVIACRFQNALRGYIKM